MQNKLILFIYIFILFIEGKTIQKNLTLIENAYFAQSFHFLVRFYLAYHLAAARPVKSFNYTLLTTQSGLKALKMLLHAQI